MCNTASKRSEYRLQSGLVARRQEPHQIEVGTLNTSAARLSSFYLLE